MRVLAPDVAPIKKVALLVTTRTLPTLASSPVEILTTLTLVTVASLRFNTTIADARFLLVAGS